LSYILNDDTHQAPTAAVSLTPDPPADDELLTATASGSDHNGDSVLLSYEWFVNSVSVRQTSFSSSTTDSLDLAAAAVVDGDVVEVQVTPKESTALALVGTPASDTVVVNGRPNPADDSVATLPGRSNSVDVLANDIDPGPGASALTVVSWSEGGLGGDVDCTAAGVCSYSPVGTTPYNDSFQYTVADAQGAQATATVNVRVVNPPTYTMTGDIDLEGGTGTTTPSTFTVNLVGEAPFPTTVKFKTGNFTAKIENGDYQNLNGTLTFPASTASGQTQTVTVTINGDNTVEPNERFYLYLTTPTNSTLPPGQFRTESHITNDD
jgi:hypothetical protein